MGTLIKTDTSEMTFHDMIDLEGLIKDVIDEIQPRLIKNPKIVMYGKVCYQKRSLCFYSDESTGYKYSKQTAKSNGLQNTKMNQLLKIVNEKMGVEYNGILINHYKDGCDVIGAHSDDADVIDNTDISTLSYGATRNFRIRTKGDKKIVKNVNTEHCGIIRMFGNFQKEFTHEIPQQKKIKNERYSFSFRLHHVEVKKPKVETNKNMRTFEYFDEKLGGDIWAKVNDYLQKDNKQVKKDLVFGLHEYFFNHQYDEDKPHFRACDRDYEYDENGCVLCFIFYDDSDCEYY